MLLLLKNMGKYYITASIPYVNAPPHIGFALELVQADVLARYYRILGDEVRYQTGTDEHGLKIWQMAEGAGKPASEFAAEMSQKFLDLAKLLNISTDDFIRTIDQTRHWPVAQDIWRKSAKAGDIVQRKYGGWYCVGCEAFKKEDDLENGLCPDHKKKPVWQEEENYFFLLSKYQKFLQDHYKKYKDFVVPTSRRQEMTTLLERGLEDVSISRLKKNLPWGVPVPGDETQVMYVWFDALTNYISAVTDQSNPKVFKKWWPADVHLVGKDINRWHALLWPAMLKSAGYELPKQIFVHGFISSGGHKMSKSLGNVIDPVEMVKKYGVDAVRYYLLREIPSDGDGDFSMEKFAQRYQADLANGLGNLVARVAKLAEGQNATGKLEKTWITRAKKVSETQKQAMTDFKLHEGIAAVWEFIGQCDEYVEETKPWSLAKTDPDKLPQVLYTLCNNLGLIASWLRPYLPETAEKIRETLGITSFDGQPKEYNRIRKGDGLFPRLQNPNS